jgi:hypothetical protein
MQTRTVQLGDLEIEVGSTNPLRLVFRGKSNHREPDSVLRPLFHEVLKTAATSGKAIELHFEKLEFFNSSTITSVIHFIKDLRSRQITTQVTYDAGHKWQKVFFDALGMLQKADGFLQITAVTS